MPRIEIQKAKKSQKILRKQCISKQSTKSYKYKIAKSSSLSVSWDMKYTAHTKGHYGIEELELKFRKKGMQEDSYKKG